MHIYPFHFSRWLKTFNVGTASQAKQRKLATEWSGDDLVVEDAPFTFPVKDKKGIYQVKTAAWGYIKDLPNHILGHLICLKE